MKVRIKKISEIFPELALYETTTLLEGLKFSVEIKVGNCTYKAKYSNAVKNVIGQNEKYFTIAVGGGYNINVRKEWVDIL